MTEQYEEVVCPFCEEGEFDRIGLKLHLKMGWCEEFNETPLSDPPPRIAPKEGE